MLKILGLFFLILLSGSILNHSIIQNRTIKIPSIITFIVFVFLSLPLIEKYNNLNIAINLLLLTLIYTQIISFNESTSPKKKILKSGFFLGLMSLINTDFFLFFLLIFFTLIYYNQISWRHLSVLLIGVIYPWLIYYSLHFINFNLQLDIYNNHSLKEENIYHFQDNFIHLFVTLIILTLSLKELSINFYKKSEQAKKAFNVLFVLAFLILFHLMLFQSLTILYFLIVPFTIIVSNYLIYIKSKKIQTFLLGLLLISFMFKFL
jgi:hypothetical protein